MPDICTRTGPLYGSDTTRCRCALLLSWAASYYLTTSVTETVTDLPLYYCKESTTFVLLGLSWLADHFCGIAVCVQLRSRGHPDLVLSGALRPFIGSCVADSYVVQFTVQ